MKTICKYTKREQLNFAKDPSILQFDLKRSLAYRYESFDQAERNRGNFTGIKDKITLNIYVKCDGVYVMIPKRKKS